MDRAKILEALASIRGMDGTMFTFCQQYEDGMLTDEDFTIKLIHQLFTEKYQMAGEYTKLLMQMPR